MAIMQRARRLGARRTKPTVVAMWAMIVLDLAMAEWAIAHWYLWTLLFALMSLSAGTWWLDRTRTP